MLKSDFKACAHCTLLSRSGRECTHWFEFFKLSFTWWYIWEVDLTFNVFFTYGMLQIEWITVYQIISISSLYLSCLRWKPPLGSFLDLKESTFAFLCVCKFSVEVMLYFYFDDNNIIYNDTWTDYKSFGWHQYNWVLLCSISVFISMFILFHWSQIGLILSLSWMKGSRRESDIIWT